MLGLNNEPQRHREHRQKQRKILNLVYSPNKLCGVYGNKIKFFSSPALPAQEVPAFTHDFWVGRVLGPVFKVLDPPMHDTQHIHS